ncbi:hypothetical protein GALL_240810 [mine drainage metagenome]|uniref:TRAP transporter large permease subunit n=1 Tax=mine drainage metagenome TaxID=410659 RepID=A0A1J5RF40_9ZZZZ
MSAAAAKLTLAPEGASAGNQVRTGLYASVVLCYLVLKIGHLTILAPVLSGVSLLAILASLPAAGWATRILTGLFLGSGTWMLQQKGIAWPQQLGAFGEMAYLLALFAVVPVLSAPVKLGGYSQAIQTVLRGRIAGVFGLNCLATTLAYVCGSFMSMAAVPIMMTSLEPVVGSYPVANKVRFMSVAATYGYVLPILWTPVSGVVGVVLYSLHGDWLSVFPTLFALSIASLCANWAIFYLLEVRGRASPAPIEAEAAASPVPRLLQMLLGIVLLVISIVLLEQWLQIGLVTVVTLASVPFALAWSAVLGQAGRFLKDTGGQLLTRLPRMADQFAIFLSAGYFAKAMHLSGVDHTANLMFLHLHGAMGTRLFLILMPVMALIASFLGVHPLVAIALLSESLKPEVLGITSTQLAITLIGSSVLTYMLGPFSGTLGLVQSINQVSTFRLSLWNAPYAAGYFMLLVATIMVM